MSVLDEVIMHSDMLCACMEHWVLSNMNTAHVVTVMGNQILDGNTHIFNILLNQAALHVATTMPLYSTSVLESVKSRLHSSVLELVARFRFWLRGVATYLHSVPQTYIIH